MQLDLFSPAIQAERIARDRGMATAAAHAGRVHSDWSDRAFDFFRDHVATLDRRARFMAEDVRAAAEAAGMPAPPDARAWGAVTSRAARERIIKRVGYGPQRSAGCHMAPKSIWSRA